MIEITNTTRKAVCLIINLGWSYATVTLPGFGNRTISINQYTEQIGRLADAGIISIQKAK